MKLTGSDGSFFELGIAGYQSPAVLNDFYDSNWLEIRISVKRSEGSWTVTDHCLLTFEVEQLINWFDICNQELMPESECSFTEPELVFAIVGDKPGSKMLRIYIDSFMRPPWRQPESIGEKDFWVEFSVNEVDFSELANNLRSELARYPQRVFRPVKKVSINLLSAREWFRTIYIKFKTVWFSR